MNYEAMKKRNPHALEERIHGILEELCIPKGSKGRTYLMDAIKIAVREPNTLGAISKQIFSRIAQEYDTKVGCVESAIRSAIKKAWEINDPNVQVRHFGTTLKFGNGRPSDSEFIATIASMPEIRRLK